MLRNLYADLRVCAKDKPLMRPHVGGSDSTWLEVYLTKRFADLLVWIKLYWWVNNLVVHIHCTLRPVRHWLCQLRATRGHKAVHILMWLLPFVRRVNSTNKDAGRNRGDPSFVSRFRAAARSHTQTRLLKTELEFVTETSLVCCCSIKNPLRTNLAL